jgi:putative membrane protein
MDARRGRVLLSTIALAFVMSFVGHVIAQQSDEKRPTDFKPAQAGSPGAQPVETRDRDASDRTIERRTTERRAEDRTSDRETARTRDRRDSNLNTEFAACLLDKNKGEVELGKLAAERATNEEVKDFAQRMIKDHGQQVEKLQKFVGSDEPSGRRAKIAKEIEERCLASLKKELNNKSGHDFDVCFVGSQIFGHMKMAAELEVVSDYATGELREIIKDAQPTVDKHLSHAKKLMEQLDRSGDRSQASKDRGETKR